MFFFREVFLIGERLKEVRKRLKLTQADVANQMSTSQANINRYEHNHYEPNILFLYNFCEKYNINERWLIRGTGDMFVDDEPTEHKEVSVKTRKNKDVDEFTELKKELAEKDKKLAERDKQISQLVQDIAILETIRRELDSRNQKLSDKNMELYDEVIKSFKQNKPT